MRTQRKFLAWLIALVLSVSLIPTAALAREPEDENGKVPPVCAGSEADESCPAKEHAEGCPLYVEPEEPADSVEDGPDDMTNAADEPTIEEQLATLIAALPDPEDIDTEEENQNDTFSSENSAGISITYTIIENATEDKNGAVIVGKRGTGTGKDDTSMRAVGDTVTGEIQIPETVTHEGSTYTVREIGYCAFRARNSITKIVVPDTVTRISDMAFSACTSLTEVTIPNSISELGTYVFANSAISKANFPANKNITSIPAGTFLNTKITKMDVPKYITEIGAYAFAYCATLSQIALPKNLASIKDYAFYQAKIEGTLVLENLTEIGNLAFAQTNLESITIKQISTLGTWAFANNTNLKKVTMPDTMTTLPPGTFSNTGFVFYEIPSNITNVQRQVFFNCGSLVAIYVPSSVQSIGDNQEFSGLAQSSCLYFESENNLALLKQSEKFTSHYDENKTFIAVTNGGTFAPNTKFESGKLAAPAKIGYIFDGWYDNKECTGTAVTAPKVGTTYYAKWKECTNHRWEDATCTKPKTCSICGKTDGDALGHSYQEAVTAPTCTEKGCTTHTCSRCGDSYVDTYVPATGHDWNDGVVTKEPTYSETGIRTYTCKNCGETKTEELAKLTRPSGGSSGSSGYTVSVDSGKNGSVTVSPKSASKGTTVTITVKPDKGCELDDLTVTDKDGDAVKLTKKSDTKYTFTMPSGKVEVEATFVKIKEEVPQQTFTDVPNGYWAEDAIAWAYENGYMNGNTAVTFNPEGTVSRQQLWMILARLSGYNPATMAEAKSWAVDNGISDGTAPGGAVSRQQLVTILYRYAVRMGYQTDRTADLTVYPDHAGVAAYAKDAMSWSVANSIVGGTTQGTLNPAGTATRAQFAVILSRFCENIVG